MGARFKPLLVSLLFAVAASLYMGCATMVMTEIAPDNKGYTTKKRVLTDTIIALGKPDRALTKALGKEDCIAFIGKEHAYMLSEGGKALWEISQLDLDGNRIRTDGSESKALFMKDDQVWGKLIVTYDGGETISEEQRAELRKGRFMVDKNAGSNQYRKVISIRGVVLPAVDTSAIQMPTLKKSHKIKFYATKHHASNPLVTIARVPFVVVGVAADLALLPVYTIAIISVAGSGAL